MPDELEPEIEEPEVIEGDDDELDTFGEPPNPGKSEEEQFGRLRH